MREIHASCVKFSRIGVPSAKSFCDFAAIWRKKAVGIVRAKETSEIRLTAGGIPLEFANCPRTKTT
jgi:hypothetical protein